jgi:hypothetical protein
MSDSVWEPHGAVQRAARAVAKQQGLPQSWLNEQGSVWLPPGHQRVGEVAFEASSIRVIRANPDLMLAMKVAAFRASDFEDIEWLANTLGLSDPDEIIDLAERVLGQNLPAEKRARVQTMFPSSEVLQEPKA